MRLAIDSTRCTGHGRCYDIAPHLVDDDEQGNGRVRISDVPPDLEPDTDRIVTSCPERAVTLS